MQTKIKKIYLEEIYNPCSQLVTPPPGDVWELVNSISTWIPQWSTHASSNTSQTTIKHILWSIKVAQSVTNITLWSCKGAPSVTNITLLSFKGAQSVTNITLWSFKGVQSVTNITLWSFKGAQSVTNNFQSSTITLPLLS